MKKLGIGKWIIIIILLGTLGTAIHFTYRHVKKKQEESNYSQIQVDKKSLEREITELKASLDFNKNLWEKLKKGEAKEGEKFKDFKSQENPHRNYSDKTIEKLEQEKNRVWKECQKFHEDYERWKNKHNQEITSKKKKAKQWWEIQKSNKWQVLTSSVAKDLDVRRRFHDLITIFYWRIREKKGLTWGSYDPEWFEGFEEFYIPGKEETEMGRCVTKENSELEISYPIKISINQSYLLNKIEKEMDQLIFQDPQKVPNYSYLKIGFNNLIKTIAHELAHAYQYTVNKGEIKSQCSSSGDGKKKWIEKKGKKKYKLVEPSYPQIVNEHTQLTKEIHQMILSSSEYQEFKEWWEKT